MIKLKTTKGTWKINGLYLTPSDDFYQKLKEAIECDQLTEDNLRKITGHMYPIHVDRIARTITFDRF